MSTNETAAVKPRTVLVTGAASGIGRCMTLGLASRGFRVVALDKNAGGLDQLVQNGATQANVSIKTLAVDLANFDADEVAAKAAGCFGSIDILVNNAGVGMGIVRPDYLINRVKFYEVAPSQWHMAMAVNASAVFLLSRALVRPMIDRGWGRIINVTTSLGTMLRGGFLPYGTTKASAEALSAQMANDMEGTGVTVNVITPGAVVDTALVGQTPFARQDLAQPDVMLAPLFWLCSNASDKVNGSRFLGVDFDPSLDPNEAAKRAASPIGWKNIGALPIVPPSASNA